MFSTLHSFSRSMFQKVAHKLGSSSNNKLNQFAEGFGIVAMIGIPSYIGVSTINRLFGKSK